MTYGKTGRRRSGIGLRRRLINRTRRHLKPSLTGVRAAPRVVFNFARNPGAQVCIKTSRNSVIDDAFVYSRRQYRVLLKISSATKLPVHISRPIAPVPPFLISRRNIWFFFVFFFEYIRRVHPVNTAESRTDWIINILYCYIFIQGPYRNACSFSEYIFGKILMVQQSVSEDNFELPGAGAETLNKIYSVNWKKVKYYWRLDHHCS